MVDGWPATRVSFAFAVGVVLSAPDDLQDLRPIGSGQNNGGGGGEYGGGGFGGGGGANRSGSERSFNS